MMKQRQDAWTDENDLLLAETVLRHVREGSTQLNAFEEVGDILNRTSAACGFRWNAVVRHQYEKALQLAKKQRKQRQRALGAEAAKKKLLYNPTETEVFYQEYQDYQAEYAMEYDMNLQGMEVDEQEDHDWTPEAEEVEVEVQAAAPVAKEEPTPLPQSIPLPAPQSNYMPRNNYVPSEPQSSSMTIDSVITFLHSLKGSTRSTTLLSTENERLKQENHELAKKNKELEHKVSKLEQQTLQMQEDYETLMKIMNRARKLVLFEEEERPATTFKMDRNGNLEKVAE